jgi:tripartite-type tricarboxylate transporter receptor subunit TctC
MSAWCRVAISAVTAMLVAASSAVAGNFPERPIQLVAPYPAGGAADVVARLLGKALEAELGQSVIILNKPGAGTIIGAQAVATAQPDGYTLLISSNSTFSMNPVVYAKLPYKPATDFEPIGMVATLPLAILTQTDSGIADIGQLVAAAKADPKKFMYASFGNATSSHFAGEMFKAAAGIEVMHVPYRGSSPAMTDLLGGRVQLAVDSIVAALPHIQAGQLRALAVVPARRAALLPDVPTVAENGFPGFDLTVWIALVAPRGIPDDVRTRLARALEAVMAKAEIQDKLKGVGFEAAYAPLNDWAEFVAKDIARMQEVATRAQIKADQ